MKRRQKRYRNCHHRQIDFIVHRQLASPAAVMSQFKCIIEFHFHHYALLRCSPEILNALVSNNSVFPGDDLYQR